jgi:TonB family protein
MATYASDWRRWHYEPPGDELFRRCLTVSGLAGAMFLLIVLIAPVRPRAITSVEQLPERFARLIIEKPKPVAKPAPVAPARIEQPAAPAPRVEAAPAPAATPTPSRRRRESAVPVDPDAGRAGRERAQQQVAALSRSTASLDQAIGGLTSSLDATPEAAPSGAGGGRGRRGRTVRAGRSEGELGSVRADVGGGGATDLGGSAVAGATVAVGSLSGSAGGGATGEAAGGGPGGHGTGSAPGVYRSNASLLAVIQKYAPGIQYCYGNELKREAGLRGKLVVAMTVAASGEVTDVAVVQNSTGSQRLASCALSQIREWRFPAIDGGPTAFQTPFVFTPPE